MLIFDAKICKNIKKCKKIAPNVYLFNIFCIYLQCWLIGSSLTLCYVFVKVLEKVSKIKSFFK